MPNSDIKHTPGHCNTMGKVSEGILFIGPPCTSSSFTLSSDSELKVKLLDVQLQVVQ